MIMPQNPARAYKNLYSVDHFHLERQTGSYGIKKPEGAARDRQQNITDPSLIPERVRE